MAKEVWIVGRTDRKNYRIWVFRGVFKSRARAIKACKDGQDFIGPINLNQELDEIPRDWPRAYHPKV